MGTRDQGWHVLKGEALLKVPESGAASRGGLGRDVQGQDNTEGGNGISCRGRRVPGGGSGALGGWEALD